MVKLPYLVPWSWWKGFGVSDESLTTGAPAFEQLLKLGIYTAGPVLG